jgi:dTDP-4-dehydrorhamnose 3,5-epimerase
MIFEELSLEGAYIIEPEPETDERGFFARTFCRREFSSHGLNCRVVQCSISYNQVRGTIRGMHYQAAPFMETKLLNCIKGSLYDVIVDLRPQSITYMKWEAVILTGENRRILYVPEGFAHGYQTLAHSSEVYYQISEYYNPDSQRGIKWDDPVLAIPWPINNPIVSLRDQAWPYLKMGGKKLI